MVFLKEVLIYQESMYFASKQDYIYHAFVQKYGIISTDISPDVCAVWLYIKHDLV